MNLKVSAPPAQVFKTGKMSSFNVIGEVTEAIHKVLLDSYDLSERKPRIEEDLKFVPKDREEVIYIYMYRAAQNPNLQNQKRLRQAPIEIPAGEGGNPEFFYHRPPLLMDLFYMIGVHSKFRSDAERLLGWVLLTLNYQPRLIYRPRRFALPDGRVLDSVGRPWDPKSDTEVEGLQVEKVSLSLVDDLTVGDAINLYTLHEAPYRPCLTYRARVALDGPLTSTEGGSTIDMGGGDSLGMSAQPPASPSNTSPRGRITGPGSGAKMPEPPGPQAHNIRRRFENPPDEETED